MAKTSIDKDPVLDFSRQAQWQAWLAKQHKKAAGAWLRLYKKDSGKATLSYAQALDSALCYGWIDGQKRSYDAQSWIQRFSPRRSRSAWSKINQGHVARLSKAGKMKPAGLAQVEAAKADGRWAQAYGYSTAAVPADFLKRLAKDKKALAFFKTLNKANSFAIYYRLNSAKKPETRARRLEAILAMMAKGEKFH